jgi:hypothetical protein
MFSKIAVRLPLEFHGLATLALGGKPHWMIN